jgi:hypothetical protein
MSVAPAGPSRSSTLDIYDVDTEGGQSVLFVFPTGETALIDTGWAGGRDAPRIIRTARAAGVVEIATLSSLTIIPTTSAGSRRSPDKSRSSIKSIMAQQFSRQDSESKRAYDAASARDTHIIVKPGDRLPITGVHWTIDPPPAGHYRPASRERPAGRRGIGRRPRPTRLIASNGRIDANVSLRPINAHWVFDFDGRNL